LGKLAVVAVVEVWVETDSIAFTQTFSAQLDAINACVQRWVVTLGSRVKVVAAWVGSAIHVCASRSRELLNLATAAIVESLVEADSIALSQILSAELHAIHTVIQIWLENTSRPSVNVLTTLVSPTRNGPT